MTQPALKNTSNKSATVSKANIEIVAIARGRALAVETPANPTTQCVEAWRSIPGRVWYGLPEVKSTSGKPQPRGVNIIPATSRAGLWQLLCTFYPGCSVIGPKGPFVIPGDEKVPF